MRREGIYLIVEIALDLVYLTPEPMHLISSIHGPVEVEQIIFLVDFLIFFLRNLFLVCFV